MQNLIKNSQLKHCFHVMGKFWLKKNEEENKPVENYLEVHEDELDQKYLFHSQWD